MRFVFTAMALVFFAVPAFAQTSNPILNPGGDNLLHPGTPSGSKDILNPGNRPLFHSGKQQPQLAPDACRQLTEYMPEPGAHVAYEPGVDATGKPVAGADLNRSAITPPRVITFSIDADVAQYANIPLPQGQNLTSLGVVDIDTKTGDMNFNGKPVEGEHLAALKSLCRQPSPPPSVAEPAPGSLPQDIPGSYEDDDAPAGDSGK